MEGNESRPSHRGPDLGVPWKSYACRSIQLLLDTAWGLHLDENGHESQVNSTYLPHLTDSQIQMCIRDRSWVYLWHTDLHFWWKHQCTQPDFSYPETHVVMDQGNRYTIIHSYHASLCFPFRHMCVGLGIWLSGRCGRYVELTWLSWPCSSIWSPHAASSNTCMLLHAQDFHATPRSGPLWDGLESLPSIVRLWVCTKRC